MFTQKDISGGIYSYHPFEYCTLRQILKSSKGLFKYSIDTTELMGIFESDEF